MKKILFISLFLVSITNLFAQVNLDSGLVAHYPFNGNANDESGNGYPGFPNGPVLTVDRFGISNHAYYFDGVDDFIDLPTGSNIQGNNPRSVTAWFYMPDVLSNNGYCIYKGGSNGTGNDFTLFINSVDSVKYVFHLRRYINDIVSDTLEIQPDEWAFFCVTYDGTNNNGISLYKDGQLLSLSTSGNGSTFNTPSVTPQIGDYTDQLSQHYYLKGKIDDVRIYNRELSASEVDSLYHEGGWPFSINLDSGLVAYYPFNGNANDESGNGNNGTVNGAILTSDRFGNADHAYSFNGINSYVSISDNNTLRPAIMSISAWINIVDTSVFSPVFYKAQFETVALQPNGFNVKMNSGCISYNGNGWQYLSFSINYPNNNNWHFIAGTFDGTRLKFYRDGVLLSDTSGLPLSNIDNCSGGTFRIGRWHDLSSYFFNGLIDDIRIYNRALNEAEIQALYYEGQAPTISITTTPATCNQSNGTATVSITGGIPPYTIVWSNGDVTETADSLAAGIYAVNIMDAQGMQVAGTATITTSNGPAITQTVTSVNCNGQNNGAINISVSGGQQPYSYEWSTGAITEDVSGLQAGIYEVVVTDQNGCIQVQSISVSQPDVLAVASSTTDATCGNSDGSATVTVTGGTAPYSYLWSTSATTSTISNLAAGTYTCAISDANSCMAMMTANIAVSNAGGPVISIDSTIAASCSGAANGAVYISVTGGATPYTYSWSNSETTEDILNLNAGIYDVTVTGSNGCMGVASTQVAQTAPQEQPICIVTVDTTQNKNIVVWENVQTSGIDYYNIYKEGSQANVYTVVGQVSADSLSYWIDPVSKPHVRSYRYKIAAVDVCGNTGPLSNPHKTIHLTINRGLGNSINLIWDHYDGFVYYTYVVRKFTQAGGWETLDSLPSNLNSYTDYTTQMGGLWYNVSVVKPGDECLAGKATGGPYAASFSNMEEDLIDGIFINPVDNSYLILYPNPARETLTIEARPVMNNNSRITITSVAGQVVFTANTSGIITTLDISGFAKGLYFVEVKGENTFRGRFVVE